MTDVMHGDGWCVVLERGKLQVHLTKRWLDDACRVELVESIPGNEWRHLCVTYDGSRETAGIRIYIDGTKMRPTNADHAAGRVESQSFDNKESASDCRRQWAGRPLLPD